MKKLLSLILAATMLCSFIPAMAATAYEYYETFDSSDNSFDLGSGWTYNAEDKKMSSVITNQIAKFSDPEDVLSDAENYEISAELVLNPYDLNAIVFKADESYGNFIMFRRKNDGNTELYRMGTGAGTLVTGNASNLQSNTVNTMKVVVQGNVYTCYMNDVEMLTYTDTAATANYRVGIRSNLNVAKGHTVTVDNFYVVDTDGAPYLREITIGGEALKNFDFRCADYTGIECTDSYPEIDAVPFSADADVSITQATADNMGVATIVVTTSRDTKTYTITFDMDTDDPQPPVDEPDDPEPDDPEPDDPEPPADDTDVVIVDNSYSESSGNPAGFVRVSESGINNAFPRVATMGGTMAVFSGTSGHISFYPRVTKDGKYKVYASWAGNEYNRYDNFNYNAEFSIITPNSTSSTTITQTMANSNVWACDEDGKNIQEMGTTVWNEIGEVNLYYGSEDTFVKVSGLQSNSRIDCIKFEYVGEAEIEAFDMCIKADGEVVTSADINDTVTASYRLNIADAEIEPGFSWELASSADGVFLPIRGADSAEFTITNADYMGKYLRFVLTLPDSEGNTLSFTSGAIKIGTAADTGLIKELTISGSVVEGGTISATPTLADEVVEDAIITYSILISDKADGIYEQSGSDTALKANEVFTCTLPEAAEKYIRIRAKLGDYVYESNALIIRDKSNVSAATNVKIYYTDTLNSYSTLTGGYSFVNKYGDADISTYRWLKGTSPTKLSYIPGITSNILSLDITYEGYYVSFEVTPRSNTDSAAGEPVVSSALYIPEKETPSKNSGGGGGGGGSRGGSKGGVSGTSTPAIDTPAVIEFEDTAGHWAQQSIEKMTKSGLLKGVSQTRFEPERNITRAEFIAVIARALGINTDPYQAVFSDVNATDWFAKEVCGAYSAGIISGSNGMFNPHKEITREEAAKMLVEAYKHKNNDITPQETTFGDKDKISPWAVEYVCNAYSLGFIQGDNNGMFLPQKYATRAQAAAMIERLLEKLQ